MEIIPFPIVKYRVESSRFFSTVRVVAVGAQGQEATFTLTGGAALNLNLSVPMEATFTVEAKEE